MISLDQFKKCFPNNKEANIWSNILNDILPRYSIDSNIRVAAFLAQCGHESNGFTILHENLNYSAAALLATWPKRFAQDSVSQYARNPEKIANKVYANRMGNGPEESGDGWKYRGRGVIQLTGKTAYLDFANFIEKSEDEVITYLETPEGALESACWFWKKNSLNSVADTEDTVKMTKIINGGLNGIEDRQARYNQIKTIIEWG